MKIFFCGLLLLSPTILFSATIDFTRTLSLGSRGEDVRELQKFLNTDSDTTIATSGAGSIGNETDYYGQATKRAVIKFQEKYREEILKPVGLLSGTGFFGASTRLKVNKLLSVASVSPDTPYSNSSVVATTPAPEATVSFGNGDVYVKYPSKYFGTPGTAITISGYGFTPTDNVVYFGDTHVIDGVKSSNEQSLAITVPNIPKGVYILSVKNTSGISKSSSFFAITDGVTPAPEIESITPLRTVPGDTVTIKGSGFSVNGNMVRTSLQIFKNVSSSDGTTLSFIISPDIYSGAVSPTKEKFPFANWVYIVNENGISAGKSFILEI